MSDHQWYYTRGSERLGPVSGKTLSGLATAGTINPLDLVWCDAMPTWASAATIPGLFSVAATVADYATAARVNYYTPRRMRVGYAGYWLRFWAAFVDGIVLLVALVAVGFVVLFIIGAAMSASNASITEIQLVADSASIVVSILVTWLYESLMESSANQATLGKMLAEIKVTDMYGNRISFGQATGRHFGKIISALMLGVGFLMAAFTERKQALHDQMAGCLVIRK